MKPARADEPVASNRRSIAPWFIGFNTIALNAKAFPATEALVAKPSDQVRIRLSTSGNGPPLHG